MPPERVDRARFEALASEAISQLPASDRVCVTFEPGTFRADFMCLGCEEALTRTKAGWICRGCAYVLPNEAGVGMVKAHCTSLAELLGVASTPPSASSELAVVATAPLKGWRAWLVKLISRS